MARGSVKPGPPKDSRLKGRSGPRKNRKRRRFAFLRRRR